MTESSGAKRAGTTKMKSENVALEKLDNFPLGNLVLHSIGIATSNTPSRFAQNPFTHYLYYIKINFMKKYLTQNKDVVLTATRVKYFWESDSIDRTVCYKRSPAPFKY